MPLLETKQLSKTYRAGSKAEVRAVADISLCIEPGSFVVLTGPSGSGKSTLLALCGALERPSQGQIWFEGRDLSACSDVELARARRSMGFVFQDFSLLPRLPVWENITYPLIPRGVHRRERYRLAESLLERFGLQEKLAALPHELSGGEQQRVAVARALAGQPALILADEPTSNLDPAAAEAVLASLRGFHAGGKTVILSSHDPHMTRLASQIFHLQAGRLATL